jgi:hypothetical protein
MGATIPAEPHGAVVVADLGDGGDRWTRVRAYRQREDDPTQWTVGGMQSTGLPWPDFWLKADGSAVIYWPEDHPTALAKVRPDPPVTYRLPDWLGAHPCQIATVHGDPDWVTVEVLGGEALNSGQVQVNLRRDVLVEVRPPSIDDPVTLPLTGTSPHGAPWRVAAIAGCGCVNAEPACVATISNNDRSVSGFDVTRDDARRIAQALWQLAHRPDGAP